MYLGFLAFGTALLAALLFSGFSFTLSQFYLASWLLAFPSIIDWTSSKLGARHGHNGARFATGLLMGAGIAVFLLMPFLNILLRLGFLMVHIAIVTVPVRAMDQYMKGSSISKGVSFRQPWEGDQAPGQGPYGYGPGQGPNRAPASAAGNSSNCDCMRADCCCDCCFDILCHIR